MIDIIKELGLESMPKSAQSQLLLRIMESLLKRLMVRAYQNLSETDRDGFERLAEKEDSRAIETFLKTKIPDFETITREETLKLIAEIKPAITP